jgi:phenylalanyl-tRNA synthetase beta subunit
MICDEKDLCALLGVLVEKIRCFRKYQCYIFRSAYFNPVSIRKTKETSITDASFRFERGIDPNITEYALKTRSSINTSSRRRNNVRCSQCIPKENRRLVFEL